MNQIIKLELCIILVMAGLISVGCSGSGTTPSPATNGMNSPTAVISLGLDSKSNVYAATTGNGTANPNGSVYLVSGAGGGFSASSWIAIAGGVPDCSRTSAMDISNDYVYVRD